VVKRLVRQRLEHEALDGDVGLHVVVAEERPDLAARRVLDQGDEVLAHGSLVCLARAEDELRLAVFDEASLALGKRVLQHDANQLISDVRARPRRASASVLKQQVHDAVGYRRGQRASVARSIWLSDMGLPSSASLESGPEAKRKRYSRAVDESASEPVDEPGLIHVL
jgi:hypothetical protein